MAAGIVLAAPSPGGEAAAPAQTVAFHWFEYAGHDAVFDRPLPPLHYRNPILPGFYPDPSIVRVADTFYLVNSTFAYFPGIPVFASHDLVHWHQLGNVLARPAELTFDGLGVSRGVFAPTIRFHDGTFYVINTAVDSGGNFISVAKDPAGPWSDPIWLPQVDGIDPSLFFDTDGSAYVLNNGPPQGSPQYDGHRAIWMQAFDPASRKLVGPRKVLVNGGVDFSKKPAWIEGPHMYRRNKWYYLMCAEGGTSVQHSEVVLRSRSIWGPFLAYPGNPILTQRDLPSDRAEPVTNAGHADLVEARDGTWWAVFLASRPYAQNHYNTGRETFLLPVTWKDDWPVILEHSKPIPYVAPAPAGATMAAPNSDSPATADCTLQPRLSGNFTCRDTFNSPSLAPAWLQLRVPKVSWIDLSSRPGWLLIHPLAASLDSPGNPSFLARRQQHAVFDASTDLEAPTHAGVAAGLAALQSENAWYFLGVHRVDSTLELFLEKRSAKQTVTIARATLAGAQPAQPPPQLKLKISGDAGAYSFFYDADGTGWKSLQLNDDASILSTDIAGGFVGTVVGPFARVQ